jgi:hypothetical protein
MSRLSNKQLLLAKIETSYNVDPTLAAANAMLVTNLAFVPDAGNMIARNRAYPNFGQSQQGRDTSSSTLGFDVDVAGSGAAGTPPLYGALLRACGLTETITAATKVVYTPISDTFESIQARFNWDKVAQVLGGMRGTVGFKAEAGKEPSWSFAFTGLYNPPSDAAFTNGVATVLNSFVDPVTVNSANSTFSLLGISAVLNSLSITFGNKTVFNDKPGRAGVDLVDRVAIGTAVVEADTVAFADWQSLCRAKTIGAMHFNQGTVSGNIVTADSAFVQIGAPTYTDVNGDLHYSIPLYFVKAAGDDCVDFTVK